MESGLCVQFKINRLNGITHDLAFLQTTGKNERESACFCVIFLSILFLSSKLITFLLSIILTTYRNCFFVSTAENFTGWTTPDLGSHVRTFALIRFILFDSKYSYWSSTLTLLLSQSVSQSSSQSVSQSNWLIDSK